MTRGLLPILALALFAYLQEERASISRLVTGPGLVPRNAPPIAARSVKLRSERRGRCRAYGGRVASRG